MNEMIAAGAHISPRDFRLLLQQEFLKRIQRNPRYSLRSFARALDCDFSSLSKILRGRKSIGPTLISRLGQQLGLSPAELQPYLEGVEKSHSRASLLPQQQYHQHSLDEFQLIADWYHYAILELMTVKGFKSQVRWIARALGITQHEASAAIDRLIRLGILECPPGKPWIDRSRGGSTTIGNAFTAVAFRKLQQQILQQSLRALEEVSFELREQSSMTMAIDPTQLPIARQMTKEFRRKLCGVLQAGPHQEVYQLSISLFPITEIAARAKVPT